MKASSPLSALVVAAVCLAFVSVFAWLWLNRAVSIQKRASETRMECDRLVAQIEKLRKEIPIEIGSKTTNESTLGEIRRSLASSKIPDSKLADLRPAIPTVIPKTKYSRADTVVSLKSMELANLFEFLVSRESAGSDVMCTKLDLRSPRNSDGSTVWDVQVTFSRLLRNSDASAGPAKK